MLALALALLSATGYGTADYMAGIASRQSSVTRVSLMVYAAGTLAIIVLLPAAPDGRPLPGSVAWGAVSGCGCGAGALALAAGFRVAPFSLAGPLSAVLGAGLALVAGLALGERPGDLAWMGLLIALPAILAVAVSATAGPGELGGWGGVRYGVLAGLGCAVSLIGLGQARPQAGVWPVLAAEISALLTVGAVAAFTGELRLPASGARGVSAVSGILGTLAAVCYLLAVHAGMLALAAVVTSLFPAVTVGLAVALAGERLGRVRLAGLVLAAVAVTLIAVGGEA